MAKHVENERKTKTKILMFICNIILSISSVAFIILNIQEGIKYTIAVAISVIISVIYIFYKKDLILQFWKKSYFIKILALLAGIGMCLFTKSLIEIPTVFKIELSEEKIRIIRNFMAIMALPFATIMYYKIYEVIENPLKKLYSQNSKIEKIITVVTVILLFVNLIYSFSKTEIIYKFTPNYKNYDVIYTSDTPALMKYNTWMNIYYVENDVRQPLFAIFASPFVAPMYLFARYFINTHYIILGLAIGLSQIVMLVTGANALAHIVEIEKKNRIGFFILYMCLYSTLLFSIILEQYVTIFFWLIMLIYSYINKEKNKEVMYTATAGTLMTNAVLLPLMYEKEDSIKIKIKKIIKTILCACTIGLWCGRTDLVITAVEDLKKLMRFTGQKLTFIDKFNQYTNFIKNCFIAPKTDIIKNSWQLAPIDSICYIGIIIFIICLIGYIINRKEKIAKISMFWTVYSFIILCIIGWGTKENGLMLYGLYFTWAFITLIYLFVRKLLSLIKLDKYTFILSIICGIAMFCINYYSLHEMVITLSQLAI